ncbi:MAG TPA: exodeoxyribonuclease VII small subunit [Alphaproteobacteria bacterium]|jgi:exodeoxyribonuclease VII small subunit|nr:exodeoxyribonuclease VII small subunit [Alphaproteobacteria bacterium]
MQKQPAEQAETGANEIPEEISRLSFEEAIAALEAIVQQLESGEVGLETSIEMYTRGSQLKRHCEEKLRAAGERVERIVIGPAGEAVGSEPGAVE